MYSGPHAVMNLADNAGISMNYLDQALSHMHMFSLILCVDVCATEQLRSILN